MSILADELDRLRKIEAQTADGEPDNMGESWHAYAEYFIEHHDEIVAALRAQALAAPPAQVTVSGERLWCSACGTVTRDMRCDCNRWPDGHEMKREPHFVNYADAMQETAHDQAKQIAKLEAQLAAATPAVGGEPVAWRWEDRVYKDEWVTTYSDTKPDDPDRSRNLTPLYAAPPDSPLRGSDSVQQALEPFAKIGLDVLKNHAGWANDLFAAHWAGYCLTYLDFERAAAVARTLTASRPEPHSQ